MLDINALQPILNVFYVLYLHRESQTGWIPAYLDRKKKNFDKSILAYYKQSQFNERVLKVHAGDMKSQGG